MIVDGESVDALGTEKRIREWIAKSPGNAVLSSDVRRWLREDGASWLASYEAQNRLCQKLRKQGVIRLVRQDRSARWVAA